MSELVSLMHWAFGEIQQAQYSTISAITFIICDIVSNFPDEVAHIWMSRWTHVKVLYLIARYYALIFLLITFGIDRTRRSAEFCKKYYWFTAFGCGMTYATIINFIFIIRTYALYGRNRFVLTFFCLACAIEFSLEFYGSWWSGVQATKYAMAPPLLQWTGCATLPMEVTGSLFSWVPCLIGSFLFFAATMYKFVGPLRDTSGNWRFDMLQRPTSSPTYRVFFRDGAAYYLLITVVISIATFLSLYKMSVYVPAILPWIYAVFSFSGSHIVLNLRIAGDVGDPGSLPISKTQNTIGFRTQYNSEVSGRLTEVSSDRSTNF